MIVNPIFIHDTSDPWWSKWRAGAAVQKEIVKTNAETNIHRNYIDAKPPTIHNRNLEADHAFSYCASHRVVVCGF